VTEETTQRRRWFRRRRDHEQRTLTRQTLPATFFASEAGDAGITPTSAMSIADVFACVRALADAAASLPLIVYRRTQQRRPA
jgi:phage portal protein BeeE